ncbi:lipase precursor [Cucurbitaria berberidis CBS 394.84]|uniref:Lipase n=1 Tax=Cucurbitaria berberidis CBS 394.84 TaxID=1168544 RepID=A0A9P4GHY1_9PLEO|nr:lipase precursor [Cucurbitaria berberidis CBS 394.84]KAF1845972.1 lipase precursor [Cucurbitaria berberidis CBS 394.84]
MGSLLALFLRLAVILASVCASRSDGTQHPLVRGPSNDSVITQDLFWELEELARIVDISYCVGTAGLGIQKPFQCASRCADRDFETFELVTAWNTGPFLSDSCGYIALSHSPTNPRLILAFRGTYSIANTIADLSTIPQAYVPYPGDDDDDTSDFIAPRPDTPEDPPPADPPKCDNCTVHMGFYSSWLNTRKVVLPHVTEALEKYPNYKLVLVGHSLGGAIATLAGLDFKARGWNPHVTTFGEPRLGNKELNAYIDDRFNITSHHEYNKFHRVTHAGDPVPLLPLSEWGFSMHSEEIFISEYNLPFSIADVRYCDGDEDTHCIAGSDEDKPAWGVPTRFKLWQLFFAHRDYFWRLGLCLPGGDPKDWYDKYPKHSTGSDGDIPEVDEL